MTTENKLKTSPPRKPLRLAGPLFLSVVLLLVAVAGVGAYFAFEMENPEIKMLREIKFLGIKTEIPFSASDQKSGLRSITVTVSQNGQETELLAQKYERQGWLRGAGPAQTENKAIFDLAKSKFKEGPAEVVITARDYSLAGMFKGNTTEQRLSVTVDTKPPVIALQHAQRYIRSGGSGIVARRI